MKVTPNLTGHYRPRVSATYPLLSARLKPGRIDRFEDGLLGLSGEPGRLLLLSDGALALQVRKIFVLLAAPMAVQARSRVLRASPLVGEKVSTRVFSSALNGKDTATKGTLFLSNGLDQLLLSDGASSLEFELSAFNPFFIVGKGVTDTVEFSDSVTFSVSAVRSDTMVGGDTFTSIGSNILSLTSNGATADSGLIFSQGYTDTLDYFAQDYVGTSSSF